MINQKYKTENNEIAYNYEQEGVFALRTANNVYISKVYDGIIEPIMKIKVGTNQGLVNAVERGDIAYDQIRNDINNIIKGQWDRQRLIDSNNINVENTRAKSRYGSLFSKEQQKNNNSANVETSNGDIQRGSVSMKEKVEWFLWIILMIILIIFLTPITLIKYHMTPMKILKEAIKEDY